MNFRYPPGHRGEKEKAFPSGMRLMVSAPSADAWPGFIALEVKDISLVAINSRAALESLVSTD
jgi:hypothetical protein